jgi:hypothetical protein
MKAVSSVPEESARLSSYMHIWEWGKLPEPGRLFSISAGYPSNLSDTEGECVQRHFPPVPRYGCYRTHLLRTILDAIFTIYVQVVPGDRIGTMAQRP